VAVLGLGIAINRKKRCALFTEAKLAASCKVSRGWAGDSGPAVAAAALLLQQKID